MRRPLPLLLCLPLLIAPATPASDADPSDLVVRTYPLSRLAAAPVEVPPLPALPLSTSRYETAGWEPPSDALPLDADAIADLLLRTAAPEAWELQGRALEIVEGPEPALRVRAEPQVQQEVERVLAFLRERWLAPITLRVDAYRILDPEAGAEVIDAARRDDVETLDRLFREGRVARADDFVVTRAALRLFTVENSRSLSFLGERQIEIAQAAVILQPILRTLRLGTQTRGFWARDPEGGVRVDLAVSSSWLEGDVDEIEISPEAYVVTERQVESRTAPATVQSPPVAFAALRCSARLEKEGDARIFAVRLPEERGAVGLAVRVALVDAGPPDTPLELADGRLLALLSPAARVPLAPLPDLEHLPWRFDPIDFGSDGEASNLPLHPGLPLGSIEEGLLRASDAASESSHDEGKLEIDALGGRLVLIGEPGRVRRALAAALAALDERPDTARLSLSGARSPIAALCAAGSDVFAVVGRQRLVVHGYEVEVANNTAGQIPTISFPLDGLVLAARGARLTHGGGVRLWGLCQFRDDAGDLIASGPRRTALIHTPRFAVTLLGGALAAGERAVVGSLPAPQEGAAPALEAALSVAR